MHDPSGRTGHETVARRGYARPAMTSELRPAESAHTILRAAGLASQPPTDGLRAVLQCPFWPVAYVLVLEADRLRCRRVDKAAVTAMAFDGGRLRRGLDLETFPDVLGIVDDREVPVPPAQVAALVGRARGVPDDADPTRYRDGVWVSLEVFADGICTHLAGQTHPWDGALAEHAAVAGALVRLLAPALDAEEVRRLRR